MRWLVLVLALALAACGSQRPAPVVYGSGAGDVTAAAPPLPAAKPLSQSAPETITVVAGDSLYALARQHGVSVRGLIDLNGLSPPYVLQVGQTLRLPRELVHDVVAGETLSGIADRYDVSMADLAQANHLADPFVITVGQRLLIPVGGLDAAAIAALPPPEPIDVSLVVEAEPLAVPPPPEPVEPAATTTTVITSAGATVAEPEPAPEPVEVTVAEPEAPPPPPPPPEPEPVVAAVVPEPEPRAGKLFAWPVQGKIVSTFGAKEGGLSNDGINIASPLGTPVVAAENGVVVYAGNEIPGFGNLVLIRHADGWVTAYAHNDTIAVKKNDRVDRGQPIATVGATGNVASPQTHFEIRKGNEPVDPLRYLAQN